MGPRPQARPRAAVGATRRPGKAPPPPRAAARGAQSAQEREAGEQEQRRERLPEPPPAVAAGGHLILGQESAEPPSATVRLSKFERVRLLGERACELAAGREARVPCAGVLDPLVVATQEFEAGLLDLRLVRCFPDGSTAVLALARG
jgi:DNA-directed RNA polymerase subunit K/omega